MDTQETQFQPVSEAIQPDTPVNGAAAARGPWLQLGAPRGFEWNRHELAIPGLPPQLEGLRIAQVTDLHLRRIWSDVYDELVARVRAETPDLIFMTGDFVNNKRNHTREAPIARRIVSQLDAPHGCFG